MKFKNILNILLILPLSRHNHKKMILSTFEIVTLKKSE